MNRTLLGLSVLFVFANLSLAAAVADFSIDTFSCTPSEVVINDVFSCTAQIKNIGDASGSVNEVRLYPDSADWLEQSNYLKSSGTSVSPGQTTEVTFTGMRATKSGNNGFSRITLDNQADTWVADNNVQENVIDASVGVIHSATSKASGETFTSTPEVTAGGNIDVTLTFTVDSGGCSIGSQSASRSYTGLLSGQKWSPAAWTVTMGTSGDCRYTLSAATTGANGVASTTVSSSSTITCSDCVTSSGSSSSSSSGGGGGGGAGTAPTLGEIKQSVAYELGSDTSVRFTFGSVEHTFSVGAVTETTATVTIKSDPQTFIFTVGDEKAVDFEGDGKNDMLIRLKSINIITKKAHFIFTPLYAPSVIAGKAVDTPQTSGGEAGSSSATGSTPETASSGGISGISPGGFSIVKVGGIVILLGLIVIVAYYIWNNTHQRRFQRSVRLKHFTPDKADYKK